VSLNVGRDSVGELSSYQTVVGFGKTLVNACFSFVHSKNSPRDIPPAGSRSCEFRPNGRFSSWVVFAGQILATGSLLGTSYVYSPRHFVDDEFTSLSTFEGLTSRRQHAIKIRFA